MAFTVITALPTPPQSTDTQAVFEARADAEIAALNPFISQTNTLAAEFNNFSKTLGFSFIGRSLTSQNIVLGMLNFTVEQNLAYAVGNYLKIASFISPSNNMYGTVTSYSGTTGAISVNVELKTGAGTFSDWVFSLSAPANGSIGGTEFVVATGTASAYAIAPTNIISIYKEGTSWDIKFPIACSDSPVASISGLYNINIVVLTSDGTFQNASARDIISGSISTLQLVDIGSGAIKLWLKDPAVEHARLSVITVDTALNIPNSLNKVIKSGGGTNRILTLPVFSSFPLEGIIEIYSENAISLQLVRQNATDVIDYYGINLPTNSASGSFLDVPFQTYLKIIKNNTSWQITASIVQTQSGGFKNKIIGGDFTTNPWQRGTSFPAVANAQYTADRWLFQKVGTAVQTISKVADAPTAAQAGIYTQFCLASSITTAQTSLAANDYNVISEKIEGLNAYTFGFGQSAVRNVTLSFWVKGAKTGIHCVAIRSSGVARSYISEYTINAINAWEYKAITIPVDNAGTWLYDTGIGVEVMFALAAGVNSQATANVWQNGSLVCSASQVNELDVVGNTFKIALVQLEASSTASPFEVRDVGRELILCSRYYQTLSDLLVSGYNSAGLLVYADGTLSIPMRAAPTATVATAISYINSSGYVFGGNTSTKFRIQLTITSSGYGFGYNGLLTFSAEL